MWDLAPENLMAMSDERLFEEGFMHMQKSRMEFALANAAAIPDNEAVALAVAYVAETCGIVLSAGQLLAIYALYPIERGKLAGYGWGDAEVRGNTLGIIAHFFLSTRWPDGADDVDVALFVARLKQAAEFMGYSKVG